MSESTETLVATLRSVADEIPSFDGVANDVIRKAARRMEEQQALIDELEKSVEWWRGCTKDCGDVINDGIESRQQLRAKVAALEAQAAIGRRAVEMLRGIQTIQSEVPGWSECPSCFCGSGHRTKERHKPDCELAAILRDAEQAAPDPATVAVDAGALEALRSAMSKLLTPMSRTEYAAARACIIEAAYSLLAKGARP